MRLTIGCRTAGLLLAVAPWTVAQGPDSLPAIREKMRVVLLRQPDYTCLETVERTQQSGASRSRVEDTLRLEVALVEGKEMFAWPGSEKFEDRELRDLVSTGMFGNGNFAVYARILFLTNLAVFEYQGESEFNRRPALMYRFRVPRSANAHRLRVNDREAVVGFHGSFYADSDTLDVRRVEVVAEDIPDELGVLAAETAVNYGRLRIDGEDFLLPVESELKMTMPYHVDRNWVRFSACRHFTGESTLSFTDPVLEQVSSAPPPVEVEIPTGLTLPLEMPPLDLMQSAVGDELRATLRSDLKDHGRLLAPKGAVAQGHILQLDRRSNSFTLKIGFHDLNWPGGHARLNLVFDRAALVKQDWMRPGAAGEIVISRQAGPHLSGILMFWRTEE